MPIKVLAQDQRRWRLLLLLCAVALLASMALAGVRAWRAPWRTLQRHFAQLTGEEAPGIRQYRNCAGDLDRCPTCHLGMARRDMAQKTIPLPFRAHGPGIGAHPFRKVGCTACHGGVGRALDPVVSHGTENAETRDPLMKAPHIQASCTRCHLPGEKPGQERLLEGANLYAGLGCPGCHPLTDEGRGGWDFGPDLQAIGRVSLDYLKISLLNPAANLPGSTMPSFKRALEKDPHAMESLLIYLESLVLPRLPECRRRDRYQSLVTAPCAGCHAGEAGRASGRRTHRCPYLISRKEELKCAHCHASGIPAAGANQGRCPLIRRHREACAVCHEGPGA